MDRLATWWDAFDVMWEDQGRFYDWTQYRKDDTVYYGTDPSSHSSRVAAERAVEHIAETPADQPLFLFISLVDGHIPVTPMPRHVDDPACADVEPWQGPAYNEADVSDKPSHIQARPLLAAESYDLVPRCEQSLTSDWVVGKVTRALRDAGRLDDTLQILTADNGWLMGDNRIEGKTFPYATPVPLYVRWPAELDAQRRTVEEPVSNLDWLPTFCELAGCGVPNADGLSIVPLDHRRGRSTRSQVPLRGAALRQRSLSRGPARASRLHGGRDHAGLLGHALGLHPLQQRRGGALQPQRGPVPPREPVRP